MKLRYAIAILSLGFVVPSAGIADPAPGTRELQIQSIPARQKPDPDRPGRTTQEAPPARTTDRTAFTDRIADTPDINQHMTWKQFLKQIPADKVAEYTPPDEINVNSRVFYENFCAPASTANHLVWLDRHGFPSITNESDPVIAGMKLARLLADTKYMQTISDPGPDDFQPVVGSGTKIENFVSGTAKFLAEHNITIRDVTVISLWSPPSQASRFGVPVSRLHIEKRPPKLYEVTRPLKGKTIVVTIIGKYDAVPPQFVDGKLIPGYLNRVGGHYYSPVGYGDDGNGNYSGNTLIYHDPAGGYQDVKHQEYHQWLRQKGPNGELEMRENKAHRFPEINCKSQPQQTCLGRLKDTYVRNKPVEDHTGGKGIWVLEGVVVIEL